MVPIPGTHPPPPPACCFDAPENASIGCCRTRCTTCQQRLTLWDGSLRAWLKTSMCMSQPSRHSRHSQFSRHSGQSNPSMYSRHSSQSNPSRPSRHSRQPCPSRRSRQSNLSRHSRQPHPSRLSMRSRQSNPCRHSRLPPAAPLPHHPDSSQAHHWPQLGSVQGVRSTQHTQRRQQAAHWVATKAWLLEAAGLFSFLLLSLPGQGSAPAFLCSPTFPALPVL